MKLVAGVDGGATHTRAIIASTEGTFMGAGITGPSNFGSVSLKEIIENIENAIEQALGQSIVKQGSLESIFLGLAGILTDKDQSLITNAILNSEKIKAKEIQVDHDIRAALAGGLAGQEGIALVVGTGSSCYGRTKNGNDWMSGGWGHLLDDKGSAYDLGLNGLISVVRAGDGRGPKTNLSKILLEKLNITQVSQMLNRVYVNGPSGKPMDKKEIASLAKFVTKQAQKDDKVAKTIIENGIEELTLMISTVQKKLKFAASPVSMIISGGTFEGSTYLKDCLLETIERQFSNIDVQEPVFSPTVGSLLLAFDMVGVHINKNLVNNLKKNNIAYNTSN